jgi:hypothetical protein
MYKSLTNQFFHCGRAVLSSWVDVLAAESVFRICRFVAAAAAAVAAVVVVPSLHNSAYIVHAPQSNCQQFIIIIIIIITISFMQGIYTYIPETMSLSNTMLQLFCHYCLWCPYH